MSEALKEVVAVLDAGDDGDLSTFWDEIEGYFNLVNNRGVRGKACCYFSLDSSPSKLKSFQDPDQPHEILFFKDKDQCWSLDSFDMVRSLVKNKASRKGRQKESTSYTPTAFYLPLDGPPTPPLPGKAWTIDDTIALVTPFIGKVPGLEDHLKKNRQYYVFSSPRSDNSRGAFSVCINKKNVESNQVIYYTVARHSREYMLARGGVPERLAKIRQDIAVIGCGAVGGYLVNLLAQSGYQTLTLVDNDTFLAENCYRHILSKRYIGLRKVIALKTYLEDNYIEMSVTPVDENANNWATQVNIEKHSVIISATGNPTFDRYLNQLFFQMAKPGQVFLSTWLEPLGLGGHVVLSLAEAQGCLNCLYTQENEFTGLPQVSFIGPGQKVSRNLTGCGGAFTPFSGLDAQQTALLAVRALNTYLFGQNESIYDCWIGARKSADQAHIVTSSVYDLHFADREDWWSQKRQYGCSVCHGKGP